MYPRLSDLFRDLFGLSFPVPIYSFGFLVALAIIVGAWLGGRELDRMYANGAIDGVQVESPDGPETASPSVLVGTIVIIAAVAGILGAKLFTILGNPGVFLLYPAQLLLSTGGLTFYGGFLVGGGAIAWYIRRHGLSAPHVADAAAPGLMLAYGIGRLGCHLAGDGDWGIAADVAAKPDWLPMWLWAETYPRAIIGPPEQPVYPTSLYEMIAAVLLFGVLWTLRRHPFRAGWLASLYLVLNGLERFLIEKIRVNPEYSVFGLTPTQAEIVSVLLMAAGFAGLLYTWERDS
ncbi:MAG: diacylglyceryl transferase [Bacteroidetes bacterium SW_9_63_38]|nr:MAG: diacylglyceryl transferase [Bacteroidetes bacterium SW_9_63_38]